MFSSFFEDIFNQGRRNKIKAKKNEKVEVQETTKKNGVYTPTGKTNTITLEKTLEVEPVEDKKVVIDI